MNKKRIAKEWLYFLFWFLFGLFILPGVLIYLFNSNPFREAVSNFYSALFGDRRLGVAIGLWIFIFAPYLIFQLIRSVAWAWKTIRKP